MNLNLTTSTQPLSLPGCVRVCHNRTSIFARASVCARLQQQRYQCILLYSSCCMDPIQDQDQRRCRDLLKGKGGRAVGGVRLAAVFACARTFNSCMCVIFRGGLLTRGTFSCAGAAKGPQLLIWRQSCLQRPEHRTSCSASCACQGGPPRECLRKIAPTKTCIKFAQLMAPLPTAVGRNQVPHHFGQWNLSHRCC